MVIFNSYVKLPEGILRNKQCHGVSENGVIDLQIMMSWQIHRECDQNNYSYWGLSTNKHHWGASPMADGLGG